MYKSEHSSIHSMSAVQGVYRGSINTIVALLPRNSLPLISMSRPFCWSLETDKKETNRKSAFKEKKGRTRHAGRALFFGRFYFILTYRPGSIDITPDALSWQHSAEATENHPALYLRYCFDHLGGRDTGEMGSWSTRSQYRST